MNEKPLTKAVWRTKYKGFPSYINVGVRVCVHVGVCLRACSPLGIPVTGLRDEAIQRMHVMCCCYCTVRVSEILETAVTPVLKFKNET